ncbi:helix-turn-helix domain-containing protein [Siminovitchia sp. 179-K 8D1 HS]|uniref:helix-turn-helix domain-containing protein n=1 Tax=Siminovitchia sp. 179-K 8D1 HS TaxID=3142385 RepID=UPI0039A096BC
MSDFLKKYADLRDKDHVKRLQSEGKITAQIKSERKKQGMSQQTLTEISGVPKSTIGGIEAGLTSPRVGTLMGLLKTLNTAFVIDGTADDRDSKNLYVQL